MSAEDSGGSASSIGIKAVRALPEGLLENELVHSARMSALGQLMAGLMHEVNTPLAYVDATFSLLRKLIDSLLERQASIGFISIDKESQTLVEEIKTLLSDGKHGIEQISRLVLSLKNFSRFDTENVQYNSIPSIVEDVLYMLKSKLKYMDVRMSGCEVPLVKCSSTQIFQTILNILSNSVHAIEFDERPGRIDVNIFSDGRYVTVKISDNGPGIPDSIRERIFDPFFTTKPIGQGSGMGLAICYRIVQNHGGKIGISTVEGEGTVFEVMLPIDGKPDHL